MNKIRYLFDEHISLNLKKAVKKHDEDIIIRRIGDIGVPQPGTLDPDILVWCEENDFCLMTNNRKTMPKHLKDHLASGSHAPGIFVLNSNMTMNQIAAELALIAGASEPSEFKDRRVVNQNKTMSRRDC
jgi:hypothetical protein